MTAWLRSTGSSNCAPCLAWISPSRFLPSTHQGRVVNEDTPAKVGLIARTSQENRHSVHRVRFNHHRRLDMAVPAISQQPLSLHMLAAFRRFIRWLTSAKVMLAVIMLALMVY